MGTKIWRVLSGALLLSACGGKDEVGVDLPVCQASRTGKLEDLMLPQPLDGVEVRSVLGSSEGPYQGLPVLTYGDSCSRTTCMSAVAESDARNEGWLQKLGNADAGTQYVIGIKDGAVVSVATTDAELIQLIGPVDTLAEAELVLRLRGSYCIRAGETGGKFQVVADDYQAICPIEKQQVLYQINADASLQELERGDMVHENACVGRRPAGLSSRRRAPCRSRIGNYLARSAELEAASVVAFQLLERELSAHGAPEALLARAREAARDETAHARLVQRLATSFGGTISPLSIRVSAVRDLEAVASENAVEGCVAETWGCLVGMHQARYATNSRLRRAYRRIAVDEARHAQLSWDIAEWAQQRLDKGALRRISSRRAQAVRELESGVSRETQSERVRRVLGLPDEALRARLFAHLEQALWS